MTAFEIAVPLVALAVAGIGILWARHQESQLDRRIEEVERRRTHRPAE